MTSSRRTSLGRAVWARLVFAAFVALVAACAAAPPPQPEQIAVSQSVAAPLPAPASPEPEPGHAIPVTRDEPTWGEPLAPVTIVEWGDFQCPFTGKLVATFHELQKAYGEEKLRIVWRNNPLPFHKDAIPAAVAARAVFRLGGSDAFWAFHARAFANQRALTPENFAAWAGEAGVDPAAFRAAIEAPEQRAKVDADAEVGKAAGVTGTPASFVNGVFVSGAQPIETFRKTIDEQLQKAEELLRSGTPPERIYATLSDANFKLKPVPKPTPQKPEDTTTVWRVPIAGSPTRGKPDALVTLVLFTDFQCPFCARVKPTIDALEAEYQGKLRVVFKHRPLEFHQRAEPASEFAIEARAQKGDAGFWKAYDILFDNQKALADPDLDNYAKTLGLDPARVARAVAKHAHAAVIEADTDLADDLQATGTPHFFINGRRLVGAQPIARFKAIIDEEILRADAAIHAGVPASRIYETLQKDAKPGPPRERIVVPPPTAKNPSKGPANARVVVQMFGDFQCPFTKRAWATMDELIAAFPGQVRVVWRHHPLPMHPDAPLASEAASEAFRQKGSAGFWAMGQLIFDDLGGPGIGRARLEQRAAELKLDLGRFATALDTHTHQPEVDADEALTRKLKISGTPSFAVADYFVSGAQPLSVFKSRVRKALGPYEPIQPGTLHPMAGASGGTLAQPLAPAIGPPRVGAKHLVVMYDGARRAPPGLTRTRDEALARANEALVKIRQGSPFADVVTAYSDEPGAAARGGDLGTFLPKVMEPSFSAALLKLKVGEVSSVVETPFGFHVILRTK